MYKAKTNSHEKLTSNQGPEKFLDPGSLLYRALPAAQVRRPCAIESRENPSASRFVGPLLILHHVFSDYHHHRIHKPDRNYRRHEFVGLQMRKHATRDNQKDGENSKDSFHFAKDGLTVSGLPHVLFMGYPLRSTLVRAGGRDATTPL
jgi:hypothetical protein